MKTRSLPLLALLIMVGFAFGCPPPAAPDSKAPEAVRPSATGGESPDELIKKLEEQVKRLEEASKDPSREPALDEKVHQFDISTAPFDGAENAKLTLVVFSEFQCPFCQRFAFTMHDVIKEFPNDLKYVFMNFPLQDECNEALNRPFHPNACMDAYAAKAAQDQGKFWEMHDWLFENQRNQTPEGILAFAKEAGMDADKIKAAIDSKQYADVLKAEAKQLVAAGGRGTPTVFINGKLAKNVRWDNKEMVVDFINKQLKPPAEEPEKATVAPAVANPESLPQSSVVLSDGTRLEDRLKDIVDRLAKVSAGSEKEKPKPPPKPKNPDPNMTYKFNLGGAPSIGPDNAKATLVVFTDFTCPYCARTALVVDELRKEFPKDLRIVFKNTPNAGHRYSLEAHEAAMEAQAQGKFWEFHDEVFKNRDKISPEYLRQLAEGLGMDMAKYDKAVAEHAYQQKILTDAKEADVANVNATPTVFLNGKWQQAPTKENLEAAIKAADGAK